MSNVTAAIFTYTGGVFSMEQTYGSGTYTPIAQVKSVDMSGAKATTVNVSTADNTDATERFVKTQHNPGECTVVVIYNTNDTTHQALRTAFNQQGSLATHKFKSAPQGQLTDSFEGVISSWDVKQTIDKDTELTIKITISGPVAQA
jgi:dihydroorotase